MKNMNKRTGPNKVLIASIGLLFIFSAFGIMIVTPGSLGGGLFVADSGSGKIYRIYENVSDQEVDLSISDQDITFLDLNPAEGDAVNISAIVHGDEGEVTSSQNSELIFADGFETGSFNNWSLTSWNPTGILDISTYAVNSGTYSMHAQSDAGSNTGPHVFKKFSSTYDNILAETMIYLPEKAQHYDQLVLLRASAIGADGVQDYNINLMLDNDNYDLDILEYNTNQYGVMQRNEWAFDVIDLTPNQWHSIAILADDTSFSVLVNDETVFEGIRHDNLNFDSIFLGDTKGSSGGWGDAYWDDASVWTLSEDISTDPGQDVTCTVSFYLDSIAEANFIDCQDNVFVPAGQDITVNTEWISIAGNHDIIVDITNVLPNDIDMTNNQATASINVISMPPAEEVDLSISDSDITFLDLNPVEGDAVNISAVIHGGLSVESSIERLGVVLDVASPGNYDDYGVDNPFILKEASTYKMWYNGYETTGGNSGRICYAVSTNGIDWVRQGVAIELGTSGDLDERHATAPCVLKDGETYRMWYAGYGPDRSRILYATSSDGINWAKHGLAIDVGSSGNLDDTHVDHPFVLKEDNMYKMWYGGADNWIGSGGHHRVFYATSLDGINWVKYTDSSGPIPVLDLGATGEIDSNQVYGAYVLEDGDTYSMWYGGDNGGNYNFRILSATSTDGIDWIKQGLALDVGESGELDDTCVLCPFILKDQERGVDALYYAGYETTGTPARIFLARLKESTQGVDATCRVSFYLDSIAEANLIDRQDNVSVPAGQDITVNTEWISIAGNHDIIVDITNVLPNDIDMVNNQATASINVISMPPAEEVDLSIFDHDITFSDNSPVEDDTVIISTTVHGDEGEIVSGQNSELIFSDNFESGTLDNWVKSSWNPSGVLEATSDVSDSVPYSLHVQSDPYTNTGPHVVKYLDGSYSHVLVETSFYLPVKSQMYESFDIIRMGSSQGTSLSTANYDFFVVLGDDDYSIDLFEYVLDDGTWTRHSTTMDMFELSPTIWYDISLELTESEYILSVNNSTIGTGPRTVSTPLHHLLLGDEGGSGGVWGDAYWDDVNVWSLSEATSTDPGQDANCTVSFYLDSIAEANLIDRQDNVSVPAGQDITVNTEWISIVGNHDIIVDITNVLPNDIDMTNNQATASIDVSVLNYPPVAKAGPDKTTVVDTDIHFDASGSFDPDGTIVSYSWDFGDEAAGTGINSTHSYAAKGNYTVILTITDNDGDIDQDTCMIEVTCPVIIIPTPSNITIMKVKTVGPDIVQTHTCYGWELQITVNNDGGSNASGLMVYDVLPAELKLNDYTITQGTFTYAQRGGGRMGSTHMEWNLGLLGPGETAQLTLLISTGTNPAGKIEFTSPGIYSLNDGAWLVGIDTMTGDPIEAGPTPPILVTAVESLETEEIDTVTSNTGLDDDIKPQVPTMFQEIIENIKNNLPMIEIPEVTQDGQIDNDVSFGVANNFNGYIMVVVCAVLSTALFSKAHNKNIKKSLTIKERDQLLMRGEISEKEYLDML